MKLNLAMCARVIPCALTFSIGVNAIAQQPAALASGSSGAHATDSTPKSPVRTDDPCAASDDPNKGMWLIEDHIVWHEAALQTPERKFSWAKIDATNSKIVSGSTPPVGEAVQITLIAGSIGETSAGRCVLPPLKPG